MAIQVDKEKLKATVVSFIKEADMESLTLKSVLKMAENDLNLPSDFIRASKELKSFVKTVIVEYSPTEKENLIRNQDTRSHGTTVINRNNGKKKKKRKIDSKKEKQDPLDRKLRKLNMLQRVAGIGPSIYRGLSSNKKERVNQLSSKLKESGVNFSGLIPTELEIRKIKKETEEKRELDGIDVNNIIENRSRRTSRSVKYVSENESGEESISTDNQSDQSSEVEFE